MAKQAVYMPTYVTATAEWNLEANGSMNATGVIGLRACRSLTGQGISESASVSARVVSLPSVILLLINVTLATTEVIPSVCRLRTTAKLPNSAVLVN